MIDEITWLYLHQVYLFKDEDEFQDYLDYVNSEEEILDEKENS